VVARVGLVGAGRSDWQVVVESSDGAGVVRQHSLGGQEWVEGLNWSALQRERSPLDRDQRPQRFPLDRPGGVVDSAVRDWLHRLDRLDWLHGLYGLYDWLGVVSMLGCWLGMVGLGPLCGVLSMVGSMGSMFSMMGSMGGRFRMVGSMSGSFSMLLAMVGVVVVVVMIVTISRDQGEDH